MIQWPKFGTRGLDTLTTRPLGPWCKKKWWKDYPQSLRSMLYVRFVSSEKNIERRYLRRVTGMIQRNCSWYIQTCVGLSLLPQPVERGTYFCSSTITLESLGFIFCHIKMEVLNCLRALKDMWKRKLAWISGVWEVTEVVSSPQMLSMSSVKLKALKGNLELPTPQCKMGLQTDETIP